MNYQAVSVDQNSVAELFNSGKQFVVRALIDAGAILRRMHSDKHVNPAQRSQRGTCWTEKPFYASISLPKRKFLINQIRSTKLPTDVLPNQLDLNNSDCSPVPNDDISCLEQREDENTGAIIRH